MNLLGYPLLDDVLRAFTERERDRKDLELAQTVQGPAKKVTDLVKEAMGLVKMVKAPVKMVKAPVKVDLARTERERAAKDSVAVTLGMAQKDWVLG